MQKKQWGKLNWCSQLFKYGKWFRFTPSFNNRFSGLKPIKLYDWKLENGVVHKYNITFFIELSPEDLFGKARNAIFFDLLYLQLRNRKLSSKFILYK